MWQVKQTGAADASVSGSRSAGISLHSIEVLPAERMAGFAPADEIAPNGRPQVAQRLPSYHFCRMLRTRQSSGASAIRPRHSWPHPARSGQREQEERRHAGVRANGLVAARRAFTRTPAGRRFSGHAITRAPRSFHQICAARAINVAATSPVTATNIETDTKVLVIRKATGGPIV